MLRRLRRSRSTCGVLGSRAADGAGALDADDLGAHVGEHHRRERAGPDAGDLDDARTARRAGLLIAAPPLSRGGGACRRA